MLKKPFLKKLKNDAREKLDLKEIFPRSKVNLNKKLNNYQLRTIKHELKKIKTEARLEGERRSRHYPAGHTGVIYPDKPEHYEASGFLRDGKKIFTSSKNITITTTYKHEGNQSFYSANFFGGVAHCQLMPLSELANFLESQIMRDEEEGQFYDKITLREGDRDLHGQSKGFEKMSDSAEELYLHLVQYKRHGALIGDGGSFEYIQVCFINFQYGG
jgi:hypothetical protein